MTTDKKTTSRSSNHNQKMSSTTSTKQVSTASRIQQQTDTISSFTNSEKGLDSARSGTSKTETKSGSDKKDLSTTVTDNNRSQFIRSDKDTDEVIMIGSKIVKVKSTPKTKDSAVRTVTQTEGTVSNTHKSSSSSVKSSQTVTRAVKKSVSEKQTKGKQFVTKKVFDERGEQKGSVTEEIDLDNRIDTSRIELENDSQDIIQNGSGVHTTHYITSDDKVTDGQIILSNVSDHSQGAVQISATISQTNLNQSGSSIIADTNICCEESQVSRLATSHLESHDVKIIGSKLVKTEMIESGNKIDSSMKERKILSDTQTTDAQIHDTSYDNLQMTGDQLTNKTSSGKMFVNDESTDYKTVSHSETNSQTHHTLGSRNQTTRLVGGKIVKYDVPEDLPVNSPSKKNHDVITDKKITFSDTSETVKSRKDFSRKQVNSTKSISSSEKLTAEGARTVQDVDDVTDVITVVTGALIEPETVIVSDKRFTNSSNTVIDSKYSTTSETVVDKTVTSNNFIDMSMTRAVNQVGSELTKTSSDDTSETTYTNDVDKDVVTICSIENQNFSKKFQDLSKNDKITTSKKTNTEVVKEEVISKEKCICDICTCGRHHCKHEYVQETESLFSSDTSKDVKSLTHIEFKPYAPDEVDRPAIKRQETVLKLPEGSLEATTAYRNEFAPKEPVQQPQRFKLEDQLHLEGDYKPERRDEFKPTKGDRAPVKKPKDNLAPEGDFERPKTKEYKPGERAPIVKHPDNLKPEGGFDRPEKDKFRPGDRAPIVKHSDNLKPEGEFERPTPDSFRPGDRAPIVKHPDNLKLEGDFQKRTPQKVGSTERPKQVRPEDNLRPEGEFERPEKEGYRPGDRAPVVKRPDNLKPEGDFERPERIDFKPAEKSIVVKHPSNLKIKGDIEFPSKASAPVKGDRAPIIKPEDNLFPSGDFTSETTNQTEYKGETTERPKLTRRNTLTETEGDMITETTSKNDFKQIDVVERIKGITKHADNIIIGEDTTETSQRVKDFPEHKVTRPEKPKKLQDNLTTETADFNSDTSSKSTFVNHNVSKIEQVTIRKHQDNLTVEGEFAKRIHEKVEMTERPKQIKPKDNLKPEGDFERPVQKEYQPGDQAPVVRHPDNLRPEGEFTKRTVEKVGPAERRQQVKPEDNLRPEGDFERPEKEGYRPGDRAPVVKHPDNLKPEGEFTKRTPEKVGPAERRQQVRPEDNLRPEGDFERPEKVGYRPGERAPVVKHPDTLRPEGEFTKRTPEKVGPAERRQQVKPEDNLRPEGDFERPEKESYRPGDRAPVVKHPDNLKSEGEFTKRTPQKVVSAERPKQTKHEDNLKLEGDFERRKVKKFQPAERPVAKKPRDNLKPEGCHSFIENLAANESNLRKEIIDEQQRVQNVSRTKRHRETKSCIILGDEPSLVARKQSIVRERKTSNSTGKIDNEIITSKIYSETTSKVHTDVEKVNQVQKTASEDRSSAVKVNQVSQNRETRITGAALETNVAKMSIQNSLLREHEQRSSSSSTSQNRVVQSNQRNIKNSHRDSQIGSSTVKTVSSEEHQSSSGQIRSGSSQTSCKSTSELQVVITGNSQPQEVHQKSHHRKHNIISGSATDVTNSVLHRKTETASSEAHNLASSTTTSQRKSMQNLNSSNQSDRRSSSTLHKKGITHSELQGRTTRRSDASYVESGQNVYSQCDTRSCGNLKTSEKVTRVRSNQTSHFSLGEDQNTTKYSSYRNEFVPRVTGPCPATLIETKQDTSPYKHTRDTHTHQFYVTKKLRT